MAKDTLKGDGSPRECPKCGSSDFAVEREEYPDDDNLIRWVVCNDCGFEFSELWTCQNWEEVKPKR